MTVMLTTDFGSTTKGSIWRQWIKDLETTCMSIDWWRDKKDVVCIYPNAVEYYSAIKKEQNNAAYNSMDGPRYYHTKQSKWERDKYHMIITYTWKLKYTNELI